MQNDRPRRPNFIMAPEYIPICPVHKCDMVRHTTRRLIIYFQCPHATCECADKAPRKLFAVKRRENP
jgi:hypothetical protein